MMSQMKCPFLCLFIAIFVNQVQFNLGFGFSNCGPNTDPFIVNQLSAQPDPIKVYFNIALFNFYTDMPLTGVLTKLPGQLSIDAGIQLKSNVTGPLEVLFCL